MIYKISVFILIQIISLSISKLSISQNDFTHAGYGFSISFPVGWEMRTRFPNNIVVEGYDNYMSVTVSVYYDESFSSMTIKDFDKTELMKDILKSSKLKFKDYIINEYGESTIGGRNAYYFISSYTNVTTYKVKKKYKSIQYMVLKNEYMYIVSGSNIEEEEIDRFSKIKGILSTFTFTN